MNNFVNRSGFFPELDDKGMPLFRYMQIFLKVFFIFFADIFLCTYISIVCKDKIFWSEKRKYFTQIYKGITLLYRFSCAFVVTIFFYLFALLYECLRFCSCAFVVALL